MKHKSLPLGEVGGIAPPHSEEAESGIVGLMLVDNSIIPSILELLTPEHFYNIKYKLISKSIIKLFEKGLNIDIVSVKNEVVKDETIGSTITTNELMDLAERAPLSTVYKEYCFIILEKYYRREMIDIGGKMILDCYSEANDALDELDKFQNLLFQLADDRYKNNYVNFKSLIHKSVDKIVKLKDSGGKSVSGISTGFIDLDRYLGGLQKSDLIIVAARPAMGKTALGLCMAYNIALTEKKPVGFFSLEMSAEQLTLRLIALHSGINQYKLRTGYISQQEVNLLLASLDSLYKLPIYIDDTPAINLLELKAKARRLKFEQNIDALFVDYLQLIETPKSDSREREIALVSRTLKQIAKELDIPVIAMSQLNRSVELRADKRPQLSDLRESGSIEQDADIVLFIYRPEVYGITKWPDGSGDTTSGVAEIIIGKHRNGATGSIKLSYVPHIVKFANLYLNKENVEPQSVESDTES